MKSKSTSSTSAQGIWTAPFVALVAVNFLRMMGQAISGTALPLYAYSLGAAATAVGFVSGAFAISALLIRPFIGPAFDSFSKSRLFLIFGIVLAVAGYAYAFTTTVESIVVVRLIHGIGMGCTAPLGLAIASDILPRDKIGSGIGFYTLAQSTAQAIGPAFAIWAANSLGYFATFMITGTFMVGCCIVVKIFVKDPEGTAASRPPYRLSMDRAFAKRAIPMSLVLMVLAIPFSCATSFIAIYGQLLGVDQVGMYFVVNAVCMMLTRPLFGKLGDRVGAERVVVPTLVMFALSYVVLANTTSIWGFMIAAVVGACGFGACQPLVQAIVFKCVPAVQRGSASNTSYTGMDLGTLIGPYLGGFAIELATPMLGSEVGAYSFMWLVMIVPIAVALVVFLALRGRVRVYEQLSTEETMQALQELED